MIEPTTVYVVMRICYEGGDVDAVLPTLESARAAAHQLAHDSRQLVNITRCVVGDFGNVEIIYHCKEDSTGNVVEVDESARDSA